PVPPPEALAARRRAPLLRTRSGHDLSVHVQPYRVAAARDALAVPDARDVHPLPVQPGDRIADTTVFDRADIDRVGRVTSERNDEMEAWISRVDAVLGEKGHVVRARQGVRAAED